MLKIHLYTGYATEEKRFIIVKEDDNKDIIDLIEDYYIENKRLPVRVLTNEEANLVANGELSLPSPLGQLLYINNFWIPGIYKVEKLKV